MTFSVVSCRFQFEANEPVYFPPGKSANILRGAFGLIARDVLPEPAYRRIFTPAPSGPGPSGFADLPRPFVIRASHLDGLRIGPGERFHFDVHLFEAHNPPVLEFGAVFGEFARRGLGPGRGKAVPRGLEQQAITLDLGAPPEPVREVLVRFVTATELKVDGKVVHCPEFAPLIARVRDRLSHLSALYGGGALPLDHRAFVETASAVRIARRETRLLQVERRSARTGQTHPIGGFTGEVTYQGPLESYVPFLRAAYYTGVGRHTVWGNGAIETAVLDPALPA